MRRTRSSTHLRATLLAVAATATLAACADGGSGTAATPRQLVGFRWTLTHVTGQHRSLTVPASLRATWQFAGSGDFLASDTVNTISGGYHLGASGFATTDAATTLVGYVGADPVRVAIIRAFRAMTEGFVRVASASPSTVTMRVRSYTLTFRRSGSAVTFHPMSTTPTAGS